MPAYAGNKKRTTKSRPLNIRIIPQNANFFNKNPPKWTENQIWQPQLDDFRTLLLRDYDEIVRNINALEDFLNGLNMSNVA